MGSKEIKWLRITIILLVISLVSGGASAILVQGIAYDVLYAIHKISSVLMVIFFIVFLRNREKD